MIGIYKSWIAGLFTLDALSLFYDIIKTKDELINQENSQINGEKIIIL